MKLISNLNNQPSQSLSVTLEDGSVVLFNFYYRPAVQRWTFDFTYKTVVVQGMLMVQHSNMLRSYRNLIPFGLCCLAGDNVDPFALDDFSSARCTVYVLSKEEVALVETTILVAA